MGTIYKQSTSKYWYIKYTSNGKRYYESTGTTLKRKAKEILHTREIDIGKGIPVGSDLTKIRLDELLEDVINDYIVNNRRTLTDLSIRIRLHLLKHFGGHKVGSITTASINKYVVTRLREGAKPATVNRELAILKRAFTLACRSTPPKVVTRLHIPLLTEDNVRKGFFEEHQYQAIVKQLPPELGSVVLFAKITGWRVPSEVLTLQWNNIDFQNGIIKLDPGVTKNKEGRTFPFTKALRLLLEFQWKTAQSFSAQNKIVPWVFMDSSGNQIKYFYYEWKKACVRAGCPGMLPHDLRRTAVRSFERAGISRSVAMKLSGHKTEAVYRRYAIVSEQDLRDGVAKLENEDDRVQIR